MQSSLPKAINQNVKPGRLRRLRPYLVKNFPHNIRMRQLPRRTLHFEPLHLYVLSRSAIMLQHVIQVLVFQDGRLREFENKRKLQLLTVKVVTVAFERWSFRRGSEYSYLTRKRLPRKLVADHEDRWSLTRGSIVQMYLVLMCQLIITCLSNVKDVRCKPRLHDLVNLSWSMAAVLRDVAVVVLGSTQPRSMSQAMSTKKALHSFLFAYARVVKLQDVSVQGA